MEEVLKYTERWLTQILIQDKRMTGHDFYSMWWQNSKSLREQGVILGNELDGLYYALAMIQSYYVREPILSDKLSWRWDFVKDDSLSTRPVGGGENNGNLSYNLWWQLKEIKKKIDIKLSEKP